MRHHSASRSGSPVLSRLCPRTRDSACETRLSNSKPQTIKLKAARASPQRQPQRLARAQWVVPNDPRQHHRLGHAHRNSVRVPAAATAADCAAAAARRQPHRCAADGPPCYRADGAAGVVAASHLRVCMSFCGRHTRCTCGGGVA
eukprot:364914-Chlamydomonas_euryale.AAC.7